MNIFKAMICVIMIVCAAKSYAQDVQLEGTVTLSSGPVEYKDWKTRKLVMQLAREKNNVLKYSLLQPAAVIGMVFFALATVVYAASILNGNNDRHDSKDLVKSIKNMIELTKAPFTLQYKKNKSYDAIEDITEELASRDQVVYI